MLSNTFLMDSNIKILNLTKCVRELGRLLKRIDDGWIHQGFLGRKIKFIQSVLVLDSGQIENSFRTKCKINLYSFMNSFFVRRLPFPSYGQLNVAIVECKDCQTNHQIWFDAFFKSCRLLGKNLVYSHNQPLNHDKKIWIFGFYIRALKIAFEGGWMGRWGCKTDETVSDLWSRGISIRMDGLMGFVLRLELQKKRLAV